MLREVDFANASKDFLEQLKKGAFLTVKDGDKVNTMTIGWGSIGYVWNRPVVMVMVRRSRFTHGLIEKSGNFTLSLPLKGQMKDALAVCGTKSGRDMDKVKECGLILNEGKYVNSPVIDGCDLFIECRIVYKQPMEDQFLSHQIKDKSYSNGDYHDLYYGEIAGVYMKE